MFDILSCSDAAPVASLIGLPGNIRATATPLYHTAFVSSVNCAPLLSWARPAAPCARAPTRLRQSSFRTVPVSGRTASKTISAPTPASKRARTIVPTRASLMTELVFKAVEVVVATVVGQTFIPSSSSSSTSSPSSTSSSPFSPPPASTDRVRVDPSFWSTTAKTRIANNGNQSSPHTTAQQLDAFVSDVRRIVHSLEEGLGGAGDGKKWTKLAICVVIDLIGSGGLGVPLLGDLLDVFTAPLSAFVLHALFANPGVTVAGFMEELLPGTDGIPTATLAWLAQQRGYISVNPLSARPSSSHLDNDDMAL